MLVKTERKVTVGENSEEKEENVIRAGGKRILLIKWQKA